MTGASFPRHRRRALARRVARVALADVVGGIDAVDVGPDRVAVLGWVRSVASPVRSVVVLVESTVVASARVSSEALGQGAWGVAMPREALPLGDVLLTVVAIVDDDLSRAIGSTTVRLDRAGVLGALDLPVEAAEVRGAFYVSGWARLAKGVDRVELRVDGEPVASARLLAVHRPDLEPVIADPEASLAGWEQFVPVPDGAADELLVEAVAMTEAGAEVLGSRTVRVDRDAPEVDDPERVAILSARVAAAAPRGQGDGRSVLVATHHLGLGGGQLYLQELLRHLREGFAVTVLAAEGGVLIDELEGWGMPVHVVGHAPADGQGYEQWMRQLVGIVGPVAPDVVLANTLGCYWGIDLAARLDRGSAWAIHESFRADVFEVVGLPGTPDAHVLGRFRAAFDGVDLAIFEADATSVLFADQIDADRRRRIDYGIDIAAIVDRAGRSTRSQARGRLGLEPDATYLLCVGTVQPRKAQALLTAAFAQLADDHPEARMLFVGDYPSPYSVGLRTMIDRLGLADRVHVEPVTPDLDDWYAAADAFVMASDIESLPRSILEAMAFGLPVIAPAVFGIPELIDDGETGMLFDPASVDDTADALRRFLQLGADEQASLALRGRDLVRATRDSSGYGAQIGDVLQRLGARRSARASS